MGPARKDKRARIPWLKMLTVWGYVTHEMLAHEYKGAGTDDDPYLLTFLDDDPGDPLQFTPRLNGYYALSPAT